MWAQMKRHSDTKSGNSFSNHAAHLSLHAGKDVVLLPPHLTIREVGSLNLGSMAATELHSHAMTRMNFSMSQDLAETTESNMLCSIVKTRKSVRICSRDSGVQLLLEGDELDE